MKILNQTETEERFKITESELLIQALKELEIGNSVEVVESEWTQLVTRPSTYAHCYGFKNKMRFQTKEERFGGTKRWTIKRIADPVYEA